MIAGCYSLDLYCEHPDHPNYLYNTHWNKIISFPESAKGAYGEYCGPTLQHCLRDARKDGWLINMSKSHCLCPHHSGKKS